MSNPFRCLYVKYPKVTNLRTESLLNRTSCTTYGCFSHLQLPCVAVAQSANPQPANSRRISGRRFSPYFSEGEKRRPEMRLLFAGQLIPQFRVSSDLTARGGYSLMRWMGYNFTTGLTIMGSHFQQSLLEWGRTFSDFWGKTVLHISSQQTYQNVCTVGVFHSI